MKSSFDIQRTIICTPLASILYPPAATATFVAAFRIAIPGDKQTSSSDGVSVIVTPLGNKNPAMIRPTSVEKKRHEGHIVYKYKLCGKWHIWHHHQTENDCKMRAFVEYMLGIRWRILSKTFVHLCKYTWSNSLLVEFVMISTQN